MALRLRASWLTVCEEVSDDMVVGFDCKMKTDIGVCVNHVLRESISVQGFPLVAERDVIPCCD